MKKLTTLFLLGTVALATPAQAELTGYYEEGVTVAPIGQELSNKAGIMSPSLIAVALKHKKDLSLTERQKAAITLWIENNSQKMRALMHKTAVLEKSTVYRGLRGSDKAFLLAKVDKTNALRKEITVRRIACRDKLRTILNDRQWEKLIGFYKADFKKHAALKVSK